MKKDNPKTAAPNRKTSLIVIAAIAVFLAAAFLTPFAIGNGTEKFSGEMKAAAEAELKSVPALKDGVQKLTSGTISYYVENVYETPPETAKSWCGDAYASEKTYYSVVISERTFFGIKTNEFTRHDACILL